MKVKDLIVKLQEFDPELPVCVADWNEEYMHPSEDAAEIVGLAEDKMYIPAPDNVGSRKGTYVCIGSSRR